LKWGPQTVESTLVIPHQNLLRKRRNSSLHYRHPNFVELSWNLLLRLMNHDPRYPYISLEGFYPVFPCCTLVIPLNISSLVWQFRIPLKSLSDSQWKSGW
jgi:hypothetical protein